jgi:flagellin-like hook-associated protein FlgL
VPASIPPVNSGLSSLRSAGGSPLADIESADLPGNLVDLQLDQVAYQAALGTTARAMPPSLLDFLR